MANLITVEDLKQYMGITETDADDALAVIVAGASAWAISHTRMNHLAASYRHHLCGRGTAYLWVHERPIQHVISVRSPNTVAAIKARYSGAANMATVEVVDGTSLRLVTSASGTQSVNTLAFPTYSTLTSLHGAIEAVADWEAEVQTSDQDHQESIELLPMQNGNARGEWLTLETTDDLDTDFAWTDSRLTRARGGAWSEGWRNWTVRYHAGYGTVGSNNADNISSLPDDLKLAVKELAKLLYMSRADNPDIRSERLESYSFTKAASGELGPTGMPLRIQRLLSPYCRLEIAD